jgi:hypothetical protein
MSGGRSSARRARLERSASDRSSHGGGHADNTNYQESRMSDKPPNPLPAWDDRSEVVFSPAISAPEIIIINQHGAVTALHVDDGKTAAVRIAQWPASAKPVGGPVYYNYIRLEEARRLGKFLCAMTAPAPVRMVRRFLHLDRWHR